jgi:Na+/proline symporter
VLVPDAVAADPEGAYAALILEVLPVGLRGFLVAAFLAAFMSTVDTHLNWGASYLSHDLAERFGGVSPANQRLVARVSVVALACLAVFTASRMHTIEGAWEFLIAFGAGSGATMLLRWGWWRISAWTETSAILASTVLSIGVYTLAPEWTYLAKLSVIVVGSAVVWLTVTWKFPADEENARAFYERVRPPGPGWARFQTDKQPVRLLRTEMTLWAIGTASVYGLLFGVGGMLLGSPVNGAILTCLGAVGIWHLSRKLA